MTKEEFATFIQLKEIFDAEVLKLVPLWLEYKQLPPTQARFLYDVTVETDETEIKVSGEEHWQYGGHEEYSIWIPRAFIFSEEYRQECFRQLEVKKIEDQRIAEEQKEQSLQEERARLIARLDEIALKYNSVVSRIKPTEPPNREIRDGEIIRSNKDE